MGELEAYLHELALELDYFACGDLARTSVISPNLLDAFAVSSNHHARSAAAMVARSETDLWLFAHDPDFDVQDTVAHSKFATPRVLGYLATSEYCEVRMHVAQNPNTSPETLDLLADDDDDDVGFDVIWNPSTTDSTLLRIHANSDRDLAYLRDQVFEQLDHRPQLLATLLGMEDDVETAVSLLREFPSQVKSIVASL